MLTPHFAPTIWTRATDDFLFLEYKGNTNFIASSRLCLLTILYERCSSHESYMPTKHHIHTSSVRNCLMKHELNCSYLWLNLNVKIILMQQMFWLQYYIIAVWMQKEKKTKIWIAILTLDSDFDLKSGFIRSYK